MLTDVTKPEIHGKVWGRELWVANNEKYCGKILELDKGYRCSIHYHKNKHETFYVLSGVVFMEVQDREFLMRGGDVLELVPGTRHRFTGLEKSQIMEVSTHHEDSDSYRVVDSGKVPDAEFAELRRRFLKDQ